MQDDDDFDESQDIVYFRLAFYRIDYFLRLFGRLTTTATIPLHAAFGTACSDLDDDRAKIASVDAAVKESVRPRLSSFKREAARAIIAHFTNKAMTRALAPRSMNSPVITMQWRRCTASWLPNA